MPTFESHGILGGIWSGLLSVQDLPPRVALVHLGEVVALARVTEAGEGQWRIELRIPGEVLSEGAHSLVLIADAGAGTEPPLPDSIRLDRLNLLAGAPLDGDLVAEIAQLRAELELLKRELRRMARSAG